MKAILIKEFGKPLKLEDVDVPKLKQNQVLIRVRSAGVCHTDVSVRSGTIYKRVSVNPPKLPFIPGHEIAGVIEDIGDEVIGFTKGDKVIINPWQGEGNCYYCKIGEEQYCDFPIWLGISTNGGYAEYVVSNFNYVYKVNKLSVEEASPLACAGVTAYRAARLANLTPSKYAMIIGAGGGLGSFGVQIVKALYGSTVIAVDINEEGLKLASILGADYVINGKDQSLFQEILRITEGRGVDAILDFVGSESTIKNYYITLAKLGRYIKVGTFGGGLPQEAGLKLHSMGWEFIGTLTGNRRDFLEIIKLAESGKIRIVVTKLSLEEANEALDNLESNKVTGRQVLIP
ncbi:NAD(P)-dependent alcohol dehydrogenase [Sulfurisphaera ohwakuensis]|uniref:Alcohol dehydrogenase catalytic domain-containing protein n=1 Tax=Sulfurisphaera ohwakuensis TaxID=69656 RepID=A0A650CK86_SULOH|nr:NAD(P)-dependent alcohol dehydrogenase [Sulfurisphaera ohwakuensis]MBB5253723.1 propanol-preferring alcohol dehydrogenase [Sulfurisphaera ohwakuensis]QGR18294.1 alcohol dehydrogenase catalytic domain-containing protein [Sulfurisphaera ohwakuensis]